MRLRQSGRSGHPDLQNMIIFLTVTPSRGTKAIAHNPNNPNGKSRTSGTIYIADGGKDLRDAMSACWSKKSVILHFVVRSDVFFGKQRCRCPLRRKCPVDTKLCASIMLDAMVRCIMDSSLASDITRTVAWSLLRAARILDRPSHSVLERVAVLKRAAKLIMWIPCKTRFRTCQQHSLGNRVKETQPQAMVVASSRAAMEPTKFNTVKAKV